MATVVKGCTNDKCVAFEKKIIYKETEEYCSKCEQPLSYVCKKCYTPIEDKEKYCALHQAQKADKADKVKKTLAGIGTAVITIGTVGFSAAMNVAKKFTDDK